MMEAQPTKRSLSNAEKLIRKPLSRDCVFKAKVASESRAFDDDLRSFRVSDVDRRAGMPGPESLPYEFELKATTQEHLVAVGLACGFLPSGFTVSPIVIVLARHLLVEAKKSKTIAAQSHILTNFERDLNQFDRKLKFDDPDFTREQFISFMLREWSRIDARLPTLEGYVEAAEASFQDRFERIAKRKLSRLRPDGK